MGNISTSPVADLLEEDFKWLETTTATLFNDDFIEGACEQLDEVDKSAAAAAAAAAAVTANAANAAVPITSCTRAGQRMLQLFASQTEHAVTHVEDFAALSGARSLEGLYGRTARQRYRVLLRIHAALLRQNERLAATAKQGAAAATVASASDGGFAVDSAADETLESDPNAILTGASIRMSLVLMKALRGSVPGLFQEMARSLGALLAATAPFALAEVPSVACRDSLRALKAFVLEVAAPASMPVGGSAAAAGSAAAITAAAPSAAAATAAGAEERAEAAALLLALGVARGSLDDVVAVVSCLLGDGAPPLPPSAAGPWTALMKHRQPLTLPVPAPADTAASFTARLEGERPEAVASATALAVDGSYLYVWDADAAAVLKIGTGFHGTIAGSVYARNGDVIAQVRAAKGVKAAAPGAEAAAMDAAEDGGGSSGGSGGGDGDGAAAAGGGIGGGPGVTARPRRFRALHTIILLMPDWANVTEADDDADEENYQFAELT
ncbi:unnamed protein product, partial [Phaeothamnion confervicola]